MANEASSYGEMVPRGDLRAAHEDRDRVVDLLRVAAGDGRLTPEELDDRVGAALTARTYGELAALVADLPVAPGMPEAAPEEVLRIDCDGSSTRRDGRWTVPRRLEVRVKGGSVTLDFTEAVTSWPTLRIDVEAKGGALRLVTKPGILVETGDLALRGSSVRVRAPSDSDGLVAFRIDVAGTAHGSSIKAGPPRGRRRSWRR